jgi:hypothetical protein
MAERPHDIAAQDDHTGHPSVAAAMAIVLMRTLL